MKDFSVVPQPELWEPWAGGALPAAECHSWRNAWPFPGLWSCWLAAWDNQPFAESGGNKKSSFEASCFCREILTCVPSTLPSPHHRPPQIPATLKPNPSLST